MQKILLTAFILALALPPLAPSKLQGGGPPPWAPAHGARAKHRYQYFPDSQVYFDLDRRVYFYLNGGSWQMSASLPGIVLGASVSLSMDTLEPFRFYAQHAKAYPSGKHERFGGSKKGKKK